MEKKIITMKNLRFGTGIPKICIPITGATLEKLLQEASAFTPACLDLMEWRADFFQDIFNPLAVLDALKQLRTALGKIPILFTFRTKQEGGEREISALEYASLLKTVIRSSLADGIDIELFMGDELVANLVSVAREHGVTVIISNHDFQKTPDQQELLSRLNHMSELGADLPKIAVMPNSARDVLTLLGATETFSSQTGRPLITMSMGKLGVISRLCGERFGSCLTFGTSGAASAPGQIPADKLKEILELIH